MASYSSPKRKRYLPVVATIPPTPPSSSPAPEMRINTGIPGVTITEEDGRAGSPRTKVAYNFQGLQLDEPGELLLPARSKLDIHERAGMQNKLVTRGVIGFEDIIPDGEEEKVRKRVKVLKGPQARNGREGSTSSERELEIPETPQIPIRTKAKERKFQIVIGPERTVDPAIVERARAVVLSNQVDPVIFKGSQGNGVARLKNGGGLARSYPSINRLSESKSRNKRAGTPPLFGSADASLETEYGEERRVVDPERAALTWHDDEITGHNPNDPDDDGEGINGIGFKPTAAEAYARSQKRRQQMAEYRNREAREARKLRSQRRRASETSDNSRVSREEQETARRVRFLEAEAKSIASAS